MMKIGSLFSGIGGLELGLEQSGIGETVWQCEIDPKCRAILERHWPEARRVNDVRGIKRGDLPTVDLICGGFPCQDISCIGKGDGLNGPRSGLWHEYLRIICEYRPRWVVVENVASGASRWVDNVRAQLARKGYVSIPIPLAAKDRGAWHRRKRIFVVAYTSQPHEPEDQGYDHEETQRKIGRLHRTVFASDRKVPEPAMDRTDHGFFARVDRIRMLGNAVVPQCAEVIGEFIRLVEFQGLEKFLANPTL